MDKKEIMTQKKIQKLIVEYTEYSNNDILALQQKLEEALLYNSDIVLEKMKKEININWNFKQLEKKE